MVLYPNKLPESERVCSGICKIKLTKLYMIFHRRTIVSQFTIVCILTKQFANSW